MHSNTTEQVYCKAKRQLYECMEKTQVKIPTFYLLRWFGWFSGKRNTLYLLQWVINRLRTFSV